MPISEEEAVELATSRGLGLTDAAALHDLARDTEHAKKLLDIAKPETTTEQEIADLVQRIPR